MDELLGTLSPLQRKGSKADYFSSPRSNYLGTCRMMWSDSVFWNSNTWLYSAGAIRTEGTAIYL